MILPCTSRVRTPRHLAWESGVSTRIKDLFGTGLFGKSRPLVRDTRVEDQLSAQAAQAGQTFDA